MFPYMQVLSVYIVIIPKILLSSSSTDILFLRFLVHWVCLYLLIILLVFYLFSFPLLPLISRICFSFFNVKSYYFTAFLNPWINTTPSWIYSFPIFIFLPRYLSLEGFLCCCVFPLLNSFYLLPLLSFYFVLYVTAYRSSSSFSSILYVCDYSPTATGRGSTASSGSLVLV